MLADQQGLDEGAHVAPQPRQGRDLTTLIAHAWELVEYIRSRLDDPGVGESERVRWAGVLASTIGTLNKLLYKAGVAEEEKADIASLLNKLSKRCIKILERQDRRRRGSRRRGEGGGALH